MSPPAMLPPQVPQTNPALAAAQQDIDLTKDFAVSKDKSNKAGQDQPRWATGLAKLP
eukprot:SAG11_NODE_18416_length_491_cov_10.461735_1_plen_56_part_01